MSNLLSNEPNIYFLAVGKGIILGTIFNVYFSSVHAIVLIHLGSNEAKTGTVEEEKDIDEHLILYFTTAESMRERPLHIGANMFKLTIYAITAYLIKNAFDNMR